jgi:hypothetical protein
MAGSIGVRGVKYAEEFALEDPVDLLVDSDVSKGGGFVGAGCIER